MPSVIIKAHLDSVSLAQMIESEFSHLQQWICPLEASTTVRVHINLFKTVLNLCLFYYLGI